VLIGFALPIVAAALLAMAGVIERGFEVQTLHEVALAAAIVLTPPAIAAATVIGEFGDASGIGGWLHRVPVSYPATFMLGLSVLQMVAITPFLLLQRLRSHHVLLQVPLVMANRSDDDELVSAVRNALRTIGIRDVAVGRAKGPKTWPMHTVAYAARHLLGAVVRGEPMQLAADGLELYAYATNVAIRGPKEAAYRVRAAIERELAFADAYLTWSDDAQEVEDALRRAAREANGDRAGFGRRLDAIQDAMDRVGLNAEEWNVLYRIRLQLEQERGAPRPR
jgi:hypothetical protein